MGNPFPGGQCVPDVCSPEIPCAEPSVCISGRCKRRCEGVICGIGAMCDPLTNKCVCNPYFVGNPDLLCMPRKYYKHNASMWKDRNSDLFYFVNVFLHKKIIFNSLEVIYSPVLNVNFLSLQLFNHHTVIHSAGKMRTANTVFRNQSVFAILVPVEILITAAAFKKSPIVLRRCVEKMRTAMRVPMLSSVFVHLATLAIHIFNVSVSFY